MAPNENQMIKIREVMMDLAFKHITVDKADPIVTERLEFVKAILEGPQSEFAYRVQEKPFAPANLCFKKADDGIVISTQDNSKNIVVYFSNGNFSRNFDDFVEDCIRYNEQVSYNYEKIDVNCLKSFSLKIQRDYELSFGFERDELVKEKLFYDNFDMEL